MSMMRDNERGATAILIAGSMVLLLGMAAVVLDLGAGFSERRQAQTGADFASLAALQAAESCPSPCNAPTAAAAGALEARDVVAANLPGRVLDWGIANCDPNAASLGYTQTSDTGCVNFTPNFDRARVVIPPDTIDTSFAAMIGANTLTVSAQAEAEQLIQTSADIIPYTSVSGCLFANQAPQNVPPCDGPSSGFFGYLDVFLYGNDENGTPELCSNSQARDRTALNLANGADHNMTEFSTGDPVVHDHSACPNRSEDINWLQVQTGSPNAALEDGLIYGVSSIGPTPITPTPGRIACGPQSVSCVSVRGDSLDHTGLWNYLVAGACPAGTDTHAEMQTCLNNWTSGVIFLDTIEDHPRFAAVPIFSPEISGPGSYPIDHFAPVWLETIYRNCNANFCRSVHTPGEPSALGAVPCLNPLVAATTNCGWGHTSGSDSVEALTAFDLKLDRSYPGDPLAFR